MGVGLVKKILPSLEKIVKEQVTSDNGDKQDILDQRDKVISEMLSLEEQAIVMKNLEYLNSPKLVEEFTQKLEFLQRNPGIIPSCLTC